VTWLLTGGAREHGLSQDVLPRFQVMLRAGFPVKPVIGSYAVGFRVAVGYKEGIIDIGHAGIIALTLVRNPLLVSSLKLGAGKFSRYSGSRPSTITILWCGPCIGSDTRMNAAPMAAPSWPRKSMINWR